MSSSENVLARLGLRLPADQNQDQSRTQTQTQNQSSTPQPQPDGWWHRLFHREEVQPPPTPKPPNADSTFKMGAWDRVKVGNRTLEQIANTMYNENRGVHATNAQQQSELDGGTKAIGHAILNGSRKNLSLGKVAPWQVPEDAKQSSLYQHHLDLARDVLREDYNGIDPVGGRTDFNHRFNDDAGIRKQKIHGKWVPIPGETVFDRIGPFPNSSKTHPEARIVIFNPEERPKAKTGKAKTQ